MKKEEKFKKNIQIVLCLSLEKSTAVLKSMVISQISKEMRYVLDFPHRHAYKSKKKRKKRLLKFNAF